MYSKGPYEWVDHDLDVLLGELEQLLQLKAVSQGWQNWVGNNTPWILFFNSFPLNSLFIFHSNTMSDNQSGTAFDNDW